MADFYAQVRESQEHVQQTQAKIAELAGRIETARQKMWDGTVAAIDIENASLADVHAHTEVMIANIAKLIMSLDDVSSAFSRDFDEMRTKTGWESVVGVFSKAKSDSMRQERIRMASVDHKLQNLIAELDVIVRLLQGQLKMLDEQKNKVEGNLTETPDGREAVVSELEALKADIRAMVPKIISLANAIASETDAAKRTRLETDLADMNRQCSEMVQQEQVQLAKSQTLERYNEKGETWVDSLQNQAATQMVPIDKLQTDTNQRVVLHDALPKSLKTAQQQDVSHRINETGMRTDLEALSAMAGIGAATNAPMADMLEAPEGQSVFACEVLQVKAKADERFAGRFEEIVRKHDANAYGG